MNCGRAFPVAETRGHATASADDADPAAVGRTPPGVRSGRQTGPQQVPRTPLAWTICPRTSATTDPVPATTFDEQVMEKQALTLELPFPPSLNHYYRHVGYRTLISRQGREYRQVVVASLSRQLSEPLEGPVELILELYPPDRRRRDADNFQKCVLDALSHAGAYRDDSQIVHLDVWKRQAVSGGRVVVRIRLMEEEELQA